jgi:hypothetical protein
MTLTLIPDTDRSDVDGPWLFDVFHQCPLRPATPAEAEGRQPGEEFVTLVERAVYVDELTPAERAAYGPVYFTDRPRPAEVVRHYVATTAAPFAVWVVSAVLAFTVFRESMQEAGASVTGLLGAFFGLPPAVQVATAVVYFVLSTVAAEVLAWKGER